MSWRMICIFMRALVARGLARQSQDSGAHAAGVLCHVLLDFACVATFTRLYLYIACRASLWHGVWGDAERVLAMHHLLTGEDSGGMCTHYRKKFNTHICQNLTFANSCCCCATADAPTAAASGLADSLAPPASAPAALSATLDYLLHDGKDALPE
jgi:hypothetical protein